jgi:hypothetical protein
MTNDELMTKHEGRRRDFIAGRSFHDRDFASPLQFVIRISFVINASPARTHPSFVICHGY